jgi:hypothetical protein
MQKTTNSLKFISKVMLALAAAGILTLSLLMPASATPVIANYLVFSVNDLALNGNSTLGGNLYAGGNMNANGGNNQLSGEADYVGNLNGSFVGGSTMKVSSLGNLDSNTAILDLLTTAGYTITTVQDISFQNSTPGGVYHVTGNINFANNASGNWTIIADNNINPVSGLEITSFITPSTDFPLGLALYDANQSVSFSGTAYGAIAGGYVSLSSGASVSSAVPLPATWFLLGGGLLTLAAYSLLRKLRSSC